MSACWCLLWLGLTLHHHCHTLLSWLMSHQHQVAKYFCNQKYFWCVNCGQYGRDCEVFGLLSMNGCGVLSVVYGVTVVSCHHGHALAVSSPHGHHPAPDVPPSRPPIRARPPYHRPMVCEVACWGEARLWWLWPRCQWSRRRLVQAGPTNNIWHTKWYSLVPDQPQPPCLCTLPVWIIFILTPKILNIIQPWSSEHLSSYISKNIAAPAPHNISNKILL